MKIGKLFLAAIIALGLMACNNEEVLQVVDGAESTISIKVIPSSNGATTKAIGTVNTTTAGSTAESKITKLEVYLFYGDVLQVYKDSTNTAGVNEVTSIPTTTGPKSIVVIANGNIGSVSSKADLLLKTKEIPVAGDLPMTGMTASDIIVAPGNNQFGYKNTDTNYKSTANQISDGAPLPITRVNARVAIVSAELDLTIEQKDIFDALKAVEVAMFNVPKESKIFGAAGTLAMNANYLFGNGWPSPAVSYAAGTANGYFEDATITFPITSTTDAPYYYVTENTATEKKEQMLIVLRGKPTKGNPAVPVVAEGLYTDGDGYTYYPVWVNAPGHTYSGDGGVTGDSKIRRNTQYNITLLIKGIGNPTIDPVQDAWLDVMVQVEPWAVVNQSVEW